MKRTTKFLLVVGGLAGGLGLAGYLLYKSLETAVDATFDVVPGSSQSLVYKGYEIITWQKASTGAFLGNARLTTGGKSVASCASGPMAAGAPTRDAMIVLAKAAVDVCVGGLAAVTPGG